jgi:hypothetical protein
MSQHLFSMLAYPTSAQNLSSVGGFRNYIKECYCCYIQPTDKDYRDVKGPGSLTATVRHRENSNDLPGFEPTSSANRARLRSRLQNNFAKLLCSRIEPACERTRLSNPTTRVCVQHTDSIAIFNEIYVISPFTVVALFWRCAQCAAAACLFATSLPNHAVRRPLLMGHS